MASYQNCMCRCYTSDYGHGGQQNLKQPQLRGKDRKIGIGLKNQTMTSIFDFFASDDVG